MAGVVPLPAFHLWRRSVPGNRTGLPTQGGGTVAARTVPNLSSEWIAPYGTVQFNFLHRFVRSDAPRRKITNFPTFVIGAGLPEHSQVGFLYSTNSTLSPGYPNEWESYGRWLPVSQKRGAPVDLGGQIGYSLAAKGSYGFEFTIPFTLARYFGRR